MNILVLLFALTLIQVFVYYYLKNNLKQFVLYKVKTTTSVSPKVIPTEKSIGQPKRTVDKISNDVIENNHVILNKSLMHLEFISRFEMYLEDKNYKMFPIEFLQEFEKIKIEAQLKTLKSTNRMTYDKKMAA